MKSVLYEVWAWEQGGRADSGRDASRWGGI